MANEYIKREDAIVAAWEGSDEWDGGSNRHRDKCIEMHIMAIPAADVVPVVRCKDCRYYLNSNEKCGLVDTRLHFYETGNVWTADCFCSWGERREAGGDIK